MSAPQLERKLGLWASVSIVIGAIIGSAIFMKPSIMAAQVGSPEVLLLVWIVAGVVSLFGAMINAEIGSMLPATGGQFIYFRHMYGNFFAFLYGWSSFIVINTSALAAISFIFAEYSQQFFELPKFSREIETSIQLIIPGLGKLYLLENIGVKLLAIVVMVGITLINYFSLAAGSKFQIVTTFLKIFSLLFLIFSIFIFGNGSTANFFSDSTNYNFTLFGTVTGFIAATSGALAAFDGWNNLGFVAGEIKNPSKNIPLGLFIGLTVCLVLYVLTNQAYLYMLPIDKMKTSNLVAADSLNLVFGNMGVVLISLMVMLSTLGAVNGNTLPCARVTFAMGEQKIFSNWAGKVHPKFNTPANALILQCVLSCMFILTGTFNMLADLFVFTTWIFYGFAGYGLFILRKKFPENNSNYKTWGYPVVPIIFILFSVFYFVVTLYNDISNFVTGKTEFIYSLYGLLLILIGVPVYLYYRNKN